MKYILIKFILRFCKRRQRKVSGGLFIKIEIYKKLFGKEYFIGEYGIPPQHINCRCTS